MFNFVVHVTVTHILIWTIFLYYEAKQQLQKITINQYAFIINSESYANKILHLVVIT